MIQWVYERAVGAGFFSDVMVATDDERIFRAVEGFGGRAVMTASFHRSGSDRAAEAVQGLALEGEDIVVNIQGDQPAFDKRCLAEVVSPLAADPDLDMSTLVYRIKNPAEITDPNHVKCVFTADYFALYFSRSLMPFPAKEGSSGDVFKHLGIYAFRKHFLETFTKLPEGRLEKTEKLEQLRALEYGYRVKVVETGFNSIEVDRAEDIPKLEAVLKAEESG